MESGHDIVLIDFVDLGITWLARKNITWLEKNFNVAFLILI